MSVEYDYKWKVRRDMTTSGQVRVSIINPESMANFVVKLEVEKLWGY